MEGKDSSQRKTNTGVDSKRVPYDLESSLVRLGGSQELFRSLVEFFLEDCPGLLQQLNTGLESNNAEQVERAGHSIKGLAANFSAQPAVHAALKIEEFGRAHEPGATHRSLPELKTELERLQCALADYLQTSKA